MRGATVIEPERRIWLDDPDEFPDAWMECCWTDGFITVRLTERGANHYHAPYGGDEHVDLFCPHGHGVWRAAAWSSGYSYWEPPEWGLVDEDEAFCPVCDAEGEDFIPHNGMGEH